MRAVILDHQRAQQVNDAPIPKPIAGEALVRLSKAAVSGIDAAIACGLLGHRGILGHQCVGVVEAINGPAADLVGKRVVVSPINACGRCEMCVAGLGRHCRNRTIFGMQGSGGCLAEKFVAPIASLCRVPDELEDDRAVFAVALASAIQASSQLTIVGRPYITVLGDGLLAMLAAQMMTKLNASVRVIGRDPDRLAICEKWGVKHRHADEVGRRADQDVVVDCTGTAEGFALALQLVRPRGKVLLKSLLDSKMLQSAAIDLTPIVLNEIEVIGSFSGPVGEAISLLCRQEVDVISLIGKRMGLDAAVLAATCQPGIIAVLVEP